MVGKAEATLRLKAKFNLDDCDQGKLLRIAETGQVLLLNDSAAKILQQLSRGDGRIQLVERFVSDYGLEASQAQKDIDHCLYELMNIGIVEDARF